MSELENTCRACLAKSNQLLTFNMKMTKNERVFQCFQNLTTITEISRKSKICKKCFKRLKNSFEFKELCLKNNDKYWELLEMEANSFMYDTKDPFDNVEPGENYLAVSEKPIDSLIEIKEEKVDIEPLDISNENTDSTDNEDNESITIQSPPIQIEIPLVIPEEKDKQKPDELRETKENVDKSAPFSCDICGIENSSKLQIENHLKIHLKEKKYGKFRFKCRYCENMFWGRQGKRSCKRHEKMFHPNEYVEFVETGDNVRSVKCRICDKEFKGDRAAFCKLRHEKTVHPDEYPKLIEKISQEKEKFATYKCQICSRKYGGNKARTILQRHQKMHHPNEYSQLFKEGRKMWDFNARIYKDGEIPFPIRTNDIICDLCGSTQHGTKRMEYHMKRSHLKIKDHVCNVCSKSFFEKHFLILHQVNRHETEKKRYQCPHCDRKYFMKHHLNTHIERHTAKNEHLCIICGKIFRTLNHLNDHIITHGTSMNFQCQTCMKKFQTKKNLQTHVSGVHEKKNSLPCTIPGCKMIFTRKSSLKNHLVVHSGIKNHKCMFPDCTREFFKKSQLIKHVVQVHLESEVSCKLCGFKIKNKREFQSSYIKHVREAHKDLPTEQMEAMEIEIRKLKTKDVCPELPASLKGPKVTTTCNICGMNLFKLPALKKHMENIHGSNS